MFSTTFFEPWKNYQTPIVRQLAFAIASPNLIHSFPHDIRVKKNIDFHTLTDWQTFYLAYQPRLIELDHNSTELLNFLTQIKSTRLGLRFEALLWFWLQDTQNQYFELLGHSIQSHQNGKTLGEIDFLVKNQQTHEIEHWEVCLKYYLAEQDLSLYTWIGLNPNDTFAQKLTHLSDQHFQFESALGHKIEKRKVVIKGQLYLPYVYHSSQPLHAIPLWINTERRLGSWLNHIPKTNDFIRLSRLEWLCPNALPTSTPPTTWWTNGLYYALAKEHFLMLRLQHFSNIYIN